MMIIGMTKLVIKMVMSLKSMPFFEEMPKWGQQDNVKFHNFALNYLYYLIEMGEMLGVKIYIAVPILG